MASTPVGILRKANGQSRRSSVDRGTPVGSPTSMVNRVHFQAPENLESLLARAADKEGADKSTLEELEGLLTHLRNQKGVALVDWLQKIQQNISILKPRMEWFVLALLRIGWADQEKPVVAAYKDFLINLVTGQGYFTKPVIKMLVSNLQGVANRQGFGEDVDVVAIERQVFENTHEILRAVLKVTPLAGRSSLTQYTKECVPYALTPNTTVHSNYLRNLLVTADYNCEGRLGLLTLVVDRLVYLDAHIGRDEEQALEEDKKLKIAKENLDSGMLEMMKYIVQSLETKDNHLNIYNDFLKVFETHILPAHNTGHVQFILFYLLGRKPTLTANFLEWLWKRFVDPNTPAIIRQATMGYIASLVSRANYISVHPLMACMEKISSWIHYYIGASSVGTLVVSSSAVRCHGAFYAACQALFYMLSFRHEEMVNTKKGVNFLRSLNLNTIITSRLNPLFFCLSHIVSNFSAVTRNYQLAYCETVIQRNSRVVLPVVESSKISKVSVTNILDSFFPFDPYSLPKSKEFFQEFYRVYNGALVTEDDPDTEEEEEENGEEPKEEENDELESFLKQLEDREMETAPKRPRTDSVISNSSFDFAYGTSPGFKH